MSRAAGRLLPLVLAVACAPPPAPSIQPIVDGTFEEGEPAVVAVLTLGGIGLCTGTLITPQVVLTAKHCVQGPGATEPFPAPALSVGVGSRMGELEVHRVAAAFTTPGAYDSTAFGLTGALVGVDVGVIVLAQPIDSITPIPVRRDRPDDLVGQTFTAIGFGQRPDGPAGLKYRGEGTLESIQESVLFTQMTICQGDSGGPMIEEGPPRRVVGVASFGQAQSCPSARDGYNALFDHLDLIDRAILRSGGCLEEAEESCNSIDDDCDGTIDEGCAALGEACSEASDCAFGPLPSSVAELGVGAVCADGVCARPCDATRFDSCEAIEHVHGVGSTPLEGAFCAPASGSCEGLCRVGLRGSLADQAPCSADDECAAGACVDPGDGVRRCLAPCLGDGGHCHVGQACTAGAASCGSCVDASLVLGLRGVGEPCARADGCISGTCDAGVCARDCARDDDCPASFHCDDLRCERGARASVDEPCGEDVDCAGALRCVTDGARQYCAAACDGECEDARSCESVGADGTFCAPGPGALLGQACSSGADCLDGTCAAGVCTRTCGGSDPACPAGFRCAPGEGARRQCARVSGGCSVSGGVAAPGRAPARGGWLLAALCLGLARRRRRRLGGGPRSCFLPWPRA